VFVGDVLVCEDNSMNQYVIAEHLKRVGLDAEIVENGQKGIDSVQRRIDRGQKPYDLIFMDIHMPVMDGIEATPKIAQLDTGTPIVAMTANIMSDDREKYRALGMVDCVGKPFTSQELWQCLMKYLRTAGSMNVSTEEKDNAELLNQLKSDFVISNLTTMSEITGAIAAGDIVLAHRLVHTIKSNAGYVGKPTLEKAAADVEAALKNGENRTSTEQMNALRINMSEALDEFAPYMDAASGSGQKVRSKSPGAACDSEGIRELIGKLEPLLKSGNPECLKLIDELQTVPGSGEIIVQMKEFYFGKAARLLSEMKKNLEID